MLTLAILFGATAIVHARTLARRRRVFLLLWLAIAVLIYRWAIFRGAWTELAAAAGIALAVFLLWWIVWGRRLAAPADDNIRVWTEEDPF